jgi:RNA polymerase sigma-70 factor (ECF subfamily)
MPDAAMVLPLPPEPEPLADPGASVGGRGASPDPDAALVERARFGDQAAFRRLVERHQDRAYAVALRITRSPTEAAEAAQEALLRAWQALPTFRGDASFGTWLHRVVARRALDRAEAMARRRGREVDPTALDEVDDPGAPADDRDGVAARRLTRLLARLSPVQRAAVTLYYLEEQPVEAVAAALGLPGNTVKTHLHRARAALREAWSGEEPRP